MELFQLFLELKNLLSKFFHFIDVRRRERGEEDIL